MVNFKIRRKYAIFPTKVHSYENDFSKKYIHFIIFGHYYVVQNFNPLKNSWEDMHHNLLHRVDAEYYKGHLKTIKIH